MATTSRTDSAQIYAFRARRPSTAHSEGRDGKAIVDAKGRAVATVAFGSGWYHEAAVQDAERDRKP